ncbi:MAG: hypothetical protein KatS3mg082_0104 [Nitrospiraceae bacterium]|nr:MAG: hypothetical protein KatS3mg082_0104 [Nitrospiraceae bacterium]
MAPAASSRVERRKARTRQTLLDVALALFSEKGIYWTKIEDITERADIGKGTFYKYFETKEALLQALLQQGLDLLLMKTKEAARGAKPGPKLLSKIIEARLDFFLEHPEYLLLFHQVRGLLQLTTESARDLRAVYDEHLDRLGALLRPALNGKGATNRTLSTALAAYTSGLLTYYLLFDKAGDLKRRRGEIQALLEQSLQALM